MFLRFYLTLMERSLTASTITFLPGRRRWRLPELCFHNGDSSSRRNEREVFGAGIAEGDCAKETRCPKIEQLKQQHNAKFSRIIPHLQPLPEANELLANLARKKGSTGDCNHGQSQAAYGDPEAAAGSSWHSNPPRR
jgi:hypothetical protein